MITDKLESHPAAQWQIMPEVGHRSHKGLNNRAGSAHLPFRRREWAMQGFRSANYLQQFVRVFSAVCNLVVSSHSHRTARATHLHCLGAIAEWKAAAALITRASQVVE